MKQLGLMRILSFKFCMNTSISNGFHAYIQTDQVERVPPFI